MRSFRFPATAVAALALLIPMGAASSASAATTRNHPQVDWISVRCAGDTLTGLVQARGTQGEVLTLTLLERQRDGAHFMPAGRTAQVTLDSGRGPNRYRFSIPIAGLTARAYQAVIRLGRKQGVVRSPVLPAGECAPGPVVPEAALPILLPASMLVSIASVGVVARTRRTRRARRGGASGPQPVSS